MWQLAYRYLVVTRRSTLGTANSTTRGLNAGALRAGHGGAGGAGADGDRRFKLDSPWAQALRKTALDPDGSQQQVLHKDEQVWGC